MSRDSWARVPLFAAIGVHLVLLGYFAPPHVLLSKDPIMMVDYALHAYQVDRALQAWHASHQLWGYDPLSLAGQPSGVAEDLTSKGTELFVIALRSMGIHAGFAFNAFIAIALLLVPFAGYAAARAFRLSRAAAGVASLLWVLLWYFDSFLHWSWWIGMITWSAVAYGSVLFLGLLQRALEPDARLRWFVPIVILAPVLAIVHPFVGLTLCVPCLSMYARRFKSLSKAQHGLVVLTGVAALLTALVWIGPFLRFKHYIDTTDTFFNARAEYLFADFFDLLRNSDHTGAPVRTILRSLCFAAGGICLWRWKKNGDARALGLGSLVIWCVFLSYFAGYTAAGRTTQPYRQIAPAMLAAAIPASELLTELCSWSALRALETRAKILLSIAVVLVVPRFVLNVLFYFPDILPDAAGSPIVLNEPKPFAARLAPGSNESRQLRDWLIDHHGDRGRVVIQSWILGEYMAATSRLPILGGLEQRNVWQGDAHLFRRAKDGNLPGDELAQFFRTYAVGWVVLAGKHGPLDYRSEVLEPVEVVGGHRVYRVREEPSYFLAGSGRIVSQALNSIQVDAASGPEVVLRFHWLETLACRPNCQLERYPIEGDRVGFIRIPAPPPSFEIYNVY
jgi:hypothetical protein